MGVESQSPERSPVLEALLTWEVPPFPHPKFCPISPHPPQGPAEKKQRPEARSGPLALLWSSPQPTLCLYAPRNPARSRAACSSNLLSCCKSLWALRFLQRHGGGPWEEQPGAPLSEEPPTTPAQESVRTLPSETARPGPRMLKITAPQHHDLTPGATKDPKAPQTTENTPWLQSGDSQSTRQVGAGVLR